MRGDEVSRDPILGAALFDEWVLRIGREFEVLVEMGLGLVGLGVGGKTGVWNGGGLVGVEEAVVEGSGEVRIEMEQVRYYFKKKKKKIGWNSSLLETSSIEMEQVRYYLKKKKNLAGTHLC